MFYVTSYIHIDLSRYSDKGSLPPGAQIGALKPTAYKWHLVLQVRADEHFPRSQSFPHTKMISRRARPPHYHVVHLQHLVLQVCVVLVTLPSCAIGAPPSPRPLPVPLARI